MTPEIRRGDIGWSHGENRVQRVMVAYLKRPGASAAFYILAYYPDDPCASVRPPFVTPSMVFPLSAT